MIRNEQIKLTAGYLNGLAIGVAVVGIFAPSVSAVCQPERIGVASAVSIVICLATSAALHAMGGRILGSLRE